MKKRTLFFAAFWLVLLGLLIYGGQKAPAIHTLPGERDVTLRQDTAQFTVELTGLWQEIDQTEMGVTLYQLEEDAAIDILLEVGGVDYYSLDEITALFGERIAAECDGFTLLETGMDQDSTSERGHTTLSYEGDNGERRLELFIYSPLQGIRYYVAYIYPTAIETSAYEEGLQIISSITFFRLEDLYAAFL